LFIHQQLDEIIFINIKNLFEALLATARSKLPSSLKSTTAIPTDKDPAEYEVGAPKPPDP
jgi:hypothetical protein